MRDGRFQRRDAEFLQRISGRGTAECGEATELEENRRLREGITHSAADEGAIIVWEIWEQRPAAGSFPAADSASAADALSEWWVHWLSPLAPEEPLRPSQRNPFRHGRLPIVRFDCEIKDKGHYASRGIPEKAGAFEASLCKYWNEKSDYLTLCNRPLFTSTQPIPNAGNLRFIPGQILPQGLSAIELPPPPVSFDQEITQTRQIAEHHIGVPDFGVGESGPFAARRTATEIERLSGLLNMGVELRARTFRMSLGGLLQLAWATLLQYDRDTQYFVAGELRRLPESALAAEGWLIQPNGSSETWNRQAQFQRALLRKRLFAQSPWIDQRELDRSILELDDPRLVQRLFLPAPAARSSSAPVQPATALRGSAPAAGVPLPHNAAPISTRTMEVSA